MTEVVSKNSLLSNDKKSTESSLNKQKRHVWWEDFSHTVAHEFKANIRAVNAYLIALEDDYGDTLDSTAQLYLKNAQKANNYIEQTLSKTRKYVDISHIQLDLSDINCTDFFESVSVRFKDNSEYCNVDLTIHDMIGLSIKGDNFLLQEAVGYLLSNAFKFTSKEQSPAVEIGSACQDGNIVFYIRDNGVGFDMVYAHKAFELFSRLHSRSEFEGLGAGLSIAKQIIEHHGGKLWCDAKKDEGACFYFSLGSLTA